MTKRVNWNKTIWEDAIYDLRPGLSVQSVAKQLGKSYALTWRWLNHFGYASPDTRGKYVRSKAWIKKHRKLDPAKLRRSKETNCAAIGRRFGVSREWVRRVIIRASLINSQ